MIHVKTRLWSSVQSSVKLDGVFVVVPSIRIQLGNDLGLHFFREIETFPLFFNPVKRKRRQKKENVVRLSFVSCF